jgi:uncharacterized membrane-anchored protein YhcB (DUF1043 family)
MFTSAFAYDGEHEHDHFIIQSDHGDWFFDDWASFDIDDGSIILEYRDRHHTRVEITEDYQLLVDDEKVDLNDEQQELVRGFYDGSMDVIERAVDLGWKGAAIGAEGAKIGVAAVAGLIKVLLTSYEIEDFEYDIERQAEKLEKKAEILEEHAEVIEEMADNLEDVYRQMCKEIPQLKDIDRSTFDDDEI